MNKALFCEDGCEVVIDANNIASRAEYQKKYKNKLFCIGCRVPMFFQIRDNTGTKYFKKWPKEEHDEECPYKQEYDVDEEGKVKRISIRYGHGISEEHMKATLSYAYRKMMGKCISSNGGKVGKIRGHNGFNILIVEGSKAISFDEIEENKGKHQKIRVIPIEQLSEVDNNEIRCIYGEVRDYCNKGSHIYLNLKEQPEYRVSIHFNGQFKNNEQYIFSKLDCIGEYLEHKYSKKEKVLVCCMGRVNRVINGTKVKYNILPSKAAAISLDDYNVYYLLQKKYIV